MSSLNNRLNNVNNDNTLFNIYSLCMNSLAYAVEYIHLIGIS